MNLFFELSKDKIINVRITFTKVISKHIMKNGWLKDNE